jgi:hypothetical protein
LLVRWKHIMVVHFGQENVFFWVHVLFWGSFSFISSSILKTHQMDFYTNFSTQFLLPVKIIVFFQQTFMFSHIYVYLNEKSHSHSFVKSHWWNFSYRIEMGQWIWLSISSSLVIVWMVFEVYLHFAVYHDDYKIFINIISNHLISISKWVHSRLGYYNKNHDTHLSYVLNFKTRI